MAKSLTKGYTDTAISGNPTMQVVLGKLNFGADFRLRQSSNNSEIIAGNVTSPIDQIETMRVAQRNVSNVYAGTTIDPSGYLPVKSGTATLVELRDVWVETDSVDTTYRKYIPVKVGITLTAPNYAGIAASDIQTLALRAVSLLGETGDVTSGRINALMHGVLKPADLK